MDEFFRVIWALVLTSFLSCSQPLVREATVVGSLPHLYFLGGTSYVILSDSGKGLIYDIGWDWPGDISMARLQELKEGKGIESIDGVTFSHHHGDHKNRLPDLLRRDDPKVWIFENMVDVFENPTRYRLPVSRYRR